ncbi:non-ribosomal peptide synthetase [Lysobacter enzymogenes]|uniref:Non-ribosomal peptide synthetase n=1 Tax=Lysobacter enzymogenes TaxID=69 RepID=A0AAU9B3D3_LYSEN|nr:non-ribosomal peptide synthetase [Lysobacter enzymogenes]BAV99526.1 non-ribosomal peptide synthetase [Lysobacter enzymogenes]
MQTWLPLTSAQSGIFHHQCRNEGNPFYNVGGYIRLERPDLERLRAAHARLVQTFEAFKLRIAVDETGVRQMHAAAVDTDLALIDLSMQDDPQRTAQAWLDELFCAPIALEDAALYRAAVLKLSDALYFYVGMGHHIALDGIGFVNWGAALARFYDDPAGDWLAMHVDVSNAELVERDRAYLDSERWRKDRDYWAGQVRRFNDSLFASVPVDAPEYLRDRSERASLPIAPPLHAKLSALSAALGVERHQLVLAVLAVYFSQSYSADSVVVAIPLHGRQSEAEKNKIGLLTQMLPLLIEADAAGSVAGVLDAIRRGQRELLRHRRFPVMEVANHADNPRPKDRLFDFGYSYLPVGEDPRFGGAPGRLVYCSHRHEQMPLLVTYWDAQDQDGSALLFDYNLGHFSAADIGALMRRFEHLLDQLAQDAQRPLARLDCVTAQERRELLALAEGECEAEVGLALPGFHLDERLARQFAASPQRIALEGEFGRVSYAELGRRVDAVAAALRADHAIARGDRVAVLLPHSPELVVALLALIRLGAVYVPIDPNSPALRTRHILADSGARLVLCNRGRETSAEEAAAVSAWAEIESLQAATGIHAPLPAPVGADDPLYILYTSGSTGVPKGVLIARGAAENLLGGFVRRLRLGDGGRWLFMSSVAFDISIVEWLGCLALGNTCVLPRPTQLADPFALAALANAADVSFVQTTPSRLKQLYNAGWRPRAGQCAVSAGEPLPMELADDLLACGVELWNGYGPTEATVYSLVKRVRADEPAPIRTAIGTQLPGYRHYVLNKHLAPVPPGLPGELCIAGAGLAVGYVNRPELTERQFVAAAALPEARLYRTGDVVRRLADGCFQYLGRNDDQIKLRGYRIELSEIRAALLQLGSVRDAAVVHRKAEGERPAQLIAYVCLGAAEDGALARVRAELARSLPGYMVPTAFVALDALPVNTNGKLDKSRLPAADDGDAEAPVALATPRERQVAQVWSELLAPAEALGGHSDFFALGGDSVLAVKMVARLRKASARKVEVGDLFAHSRLSELAARIDALPPWQASAQMPAQIPALARDAQSYPASAVQRQLWYLCAQEPEAGRYNMAVAYRIDGPLQAATIERALAALLQRHEALRTVYRHGDEGLRQIVLAAPAWRLDRIDGAGWGEHERDAQIEAAQLRHAQAPFDLGHDLPLHAQLIGLHDGQAVLLLNLHHIAADGQSIRVLFDEFLTIYAALVRGESADLPEPQRQYLDFAAWQQAALAQGAWDGQLAYWQDLLSDAPAQHALALDAPHSARAAAAAQPLECAIAPALAARLRRLAQRLAVTEFSLLQSAFALLLCKWSYSDEVTIGSPVLGRGAPELDASVGMFVNLLAYPHRFRPEQRFSDYLAQFQRQAAAALENQDIPFERVVEALRPQRDPGLHPIFQVLFAFQDDLPQRREAGGLRLERLPERALATKFDLELLIARGEDGWQCRWVSAPTLFERHSVQALASAYVELLQQLADAPERSIGQIALAPAIEADSGASSAAADVLGAHQLVERRAAQCPDAVAVRYGEQALSYAEFNRSANRLARLLLARGIAPGSRVALCLPRSIDLIVATLATLKAGCAYVPVDPAYPPARRAYLLADADPACVLTTQTLAADNAEVFAKRALLCLDDAALPAELAGFDADDIAPARVDLSPDSDAYVIYTSGSTGQPKGVLIAHRGLINLALAQSLAFGIDERSRVLQFASFSFDAAVSEWSTALASGAELVLVPEDTVPDAAALTQWAAAHRVTHATLPPVVLKRLQPSAWPTLTHAISAGEAISLDEARRWSAHCRFINAYGPSESTVCASIGGINESYGRLSIGQAMDGLGLHVLDKSLRALPQGAVGELCISGAALAKGYLNKPEQTRAAFVELVLDDGRRLPIYRTGDRVRRLPDGDLLFEGRIDEQVKIRGHRVECAEVEQCIAAQAGVAEVAVCVRTLAGDERVLAAFVVAAADASATLADDLRRQLDTKLPAYMVPSFIVALDALPLNRSGKIDRKALAALELAAPVRAPARPLTATEQAVSEVWTALLGAGAADPDRGFFESGGYSLLISDVLAAIHARFGVRPSYRQFFDHASIAGLARFIDAQPCEAGPAAAAAAAREPRRREGREHPLSFEQQRIWFIDRLEQGSRHYNMPVALQLSGRIEPELIETALRRIVARHESLRTVFAVDAGDHPVQIVDEAATLTLERLSASGADRDAEVRRLREREQNAAFDLKRDLLLRAALLRTGDDAAVLFLSLHHIAADGWSADRLIAEFGELYAGLLEGREAELPPLPIQYKDHAADQREWADAGGLDEGVAFWRRQLDGAPQCHSLPLDYVRGDAPSLRGRSWTTRIPADLTERLKTLSRRHDTTLFVALQTAFALLVARWSEHRDVLIGTPVANRHRAETAALIGFFVNTLVLRTDCRDNLSFSELLKRGRDGFLGAFEHQHIPFDALVDELTEVRNPAHAPLIQILFSLQDDPARKLAKLDLPGLAFRVLDEDGERPVKFDLELMLSEQDDGLACQWLYDTALFSQQTIARLFDSFVLLLEAVADDADARIHEIELVGGAEREALLAPPRTLPAQLAAGGLICERFEQVAQRQGESLAVIHGERRLSYAELEARSTRLANWLIANGYAGGRPVAIYMTRGIELVVAIMAIMKSGSPYLPVDLGYPAQRVDYILRDSDAALLLCDRESLDKLDQRAPELAVGCMDEDGFVADYQRYSDDPAVLRATRRLNPKSLAYVVYTSGSTGQPKGVMVRQESFLNLVLWYLHDYGFGADDRCLLIGSIGFDMTQKNLFAPLLAGGTLAIPDEYFDPAAIAALIDAQQVTVINCAPSAAYQLVEAPERWSALASLRLLALGGEAIRLSHLRAWLQSAQCRARLLNMYGPSECTDIAIAADYAKGEAAGHAVTVPIGRPIHNCSAYVLNERMKLQPRGAIGELFLGGLGVSNGYVNLDELTRKSFLDDVLPGAGRLYRTGDLARIDADGVFHYVGRADHQVKIRGYRVETAEIDAIVAGCAQVQQAMTVVREDAGGEKSLVCFVVARAGGAGEGDGADAVFAQVRQTLIGRLPGFMIPAKFVLLDAMPLTPNGKIDKRALESQADAAPGWRFARRLRAPENETQAQLLALWRELLGQDEIGIDDDFFELGGHSLLATRFVAKAVKAFELDEASLSVKEFFHHPSIEATARLIDAKRRYGRLLAKEKSMLESGAGIEEGSF